MRKMTQAMKDWLVRHAGCEPDGSDSYYQHNMGVAIAKGVLSTEQVNRLLSEVAEGSSEPGAKVKSFIKKAIQEELQGGNMEGNDNAGKLFANGGSDIRVKAASERYDNTKSAAVSPKTGRPVHNETGKAAMLPSELEYAKAGAFFKMVARRSGMQVMLNEHEKHLIEECFQKDTWCGQFENNWVTGLDGMRVKSLLADSTSGGVNVTPAWLDEDLSSYPLLHSEIFPLVDLRPVPRGNSVEGASIGNPTVTWGVGEGTPIGLFNTDNMIAAINTSIHPVSVAVTVGRDFLADSPADVGRYLMDNIGQRMAAEMDRVVVAGNGISEPEGIANSSGLGTVNSDNDTAGPPTYNDYLSLYFCVGKQYRTAAMRPVFITNDTTYQRSRNIKVDPAQSSTDQRPVLNTVNEVGNYMSLGLPHKIQNDLGNSTAIFGALAKYRMYRRQGAASEFVLGGKELALSNETMLVVRARYGGRVVDANAFAASTDMQS